ncbi:DEAD/DEAH box helicase [Pectobacterium polaris]|uniref:DEAD/DEAH box helicase n=1 Tax=Pectobacterium polaris TaxID=2042057 RepID=UPI002B24CA30|nr:DEAD/DEAH box helicase [Pectobacterium polaris]
MAFTKRVKRQSVTESPDLLFREFPRRTVPDVLPHQRDMMRRYAEDGQEKSDVALQLPTGSGKTLVGLLIAEWRRRKNNEKIVFLCPTKQLVNQVVEQAENKYGLSVLGFTGAKSEYDPVSVARYKQGQSVAITTYSSVFNVNPFFSDPDVIIIDDAHAAENYISKLWSFEVSRFENEQSSLYNAMSELIKPYLDGATYSKLNGDWDSPDVSVWVDKLPTPHFISIQNNLIELIDEYTKGTSLQYSWSMIRDHLSACHFYYSSKMILIRPLLPPTWTHKAFMHATQRIFMSATLGAGGDLERLTGRKNIYRLSIPDGWDIQGVGRRFFIFPTLSLTDEDADVLTIDLVNQSPRAVVLVPNDKHAGKIKDLLSRKNKIKIFDAKDIEKSKNSFIEIDNAVAVIANRYDGIDFPKDECRLLIIEGLPKTVNLQEQFLMSRIGANALFNERVQTRVIQAIGRCTRSLEDYSAVIVKGTELVDYLSDLKRREYFHPELQAELEFGVEQSVNASSIHGFSDNYNVFIKNDEEWEDVNKDILEIRNEKRQKKLPGISELEKIVNFEIDYVKFLWSSDFENALGNAEAILAHLSSPELKGYRALWEYLAGSSAYQAKHFFGPDLTLKAQEHFLRAKKAANGIPWLSNLYRFAADKKITVEEENDLLIMKQLEGIEMVFAGQGIASSRKFFQEERFITDGLNSEDLFEEAHRKVGHLLGFETGNVETDASPDPWWQLENLCFVFEDHANAKNDVLDATKARQASSHPNWMREHVDNCKGENIEIIPILLSPVHCMTEGASVQVNSLMYWNLGDFKLWVRKVLSTVKDIRQTFQEPGDIVWRAEAAAKLTEAQIDVVNIKKIINSSSCKDNLRII